ncbi:sodium/glutamate symporter [Geminicoccus harenae]|uniref:sodium/glutamate symporter n=1 Tax=Geminicoccus harenae TaxID=2498453 RepID=UPI00168B6CA5|nr:sodium/glutamate symporter [Geminicoccus harenae]
MIEIDGFVSVTIAILLLLTGKLATQRYEVLRRYSIPEPVVGGFLCAVAVALAYYLLGLRIGFELAARDFLLLYFFAGIGLKSDVRTLRQGGRALVVLLALSILFMVGQNLLGMGAAGLFGLDPKAGLMVGSVSLTGGVGTTVAWAPVLAEEHGIGNAMELGIAANTVGLITACVIGGPIATWLMHRHRIEPSGFAKLDVGTPHEQVREGFDYFSVLQGLYLLNIALLIGWGLDGLLTGAGLNLPTFVSCLVAGLLIRNLRPLLPWRWTRRTWPGEAQGLALISDVSLGLFLTMALMGLQLWELQAVFGFVAVVLVLQVGLAVLYTLFVVFPAMGRDYEAAVIGAGFGGISLGSTATAIANMTAVTQQHGAAHRAFIIVPLVCGFFIDIANSLLIALLLWL